MRTASILVVTLLLGAAFTQAQEKKDKSADKKEDKKEEKKPVIKKDPTPVGGGARLITRARVAAAAHRARGKSPPDRSADSGYRVASHPRPLGPRRRGGQCGASWRRADRTTATARAATGRASFLPA